MESPKTLRRPDNWQDFERLCHKLWKEIWQYRETKRNGRLGQPQNGVDIFGIPKWESGKYFGIQCKGRSEYNHTNFTKKEIDKEIEKALKFEPKLKKFYFATTAERDSVIQTYVRNKNLSHIKKGLFEIHIYWWEDIVDEIDENINTYNFYVKNQNYKNLNAVKISFKDGQNELKISPKFRQETTQYITSDGTDIFKETPLQKIFRSHKSIYKKLGIHELKNVSGERSKRNLSFCPIKFKITNTGDIPIEDYKIIFSFPLEIFDLSFTDIESEVVGDIMLTMAKLEQSNTLIENVGKTVTLNSLKNIIVGGDCCYSKEIYAKGIAIKAETQIKWQFMSRHFRDEGYLDLKIKPMIFPDKKIVFDKNQSERIETGNVKDYVTLKSDIFQKNFR